MPGVAGDFLQHTEFHQPRRDLVGTSVGSAQQVLHVDHRNDWPLIQRLQHTMAIACRAPQLGGDAAAVLLAQRENVARRFRGLHAGLGDATQEKRQPALPVATIADRLQMLVILLAVA